MNVEHFEADPGSARLARRFAVRAVTDAGFGAVATTVELMVSELATNAVLHARSAFTVRVMAQEATLRVEVADDVAADLRAGYPGPSARSGRGLGIVETCADRWGAEDVPGDGKVVWFEIGHHPA